VKAGSLVRGTIKRLEPRRGANRTGHLSAFVLQHVGDHHFGAFARANIRAVAAPMPDAAPEMMATFERHNSIIGCGATTPQDYPETTGFGGQTEREWVTSAAAPVHSRGPIHAHLHHWQ